MDRDNTIARLENIAKHAVHTAGEDTFILSLDDGIAIHEAIEALKAQLSKEGTTSDLISRQQAIDALRMDISIIPFAKAREYVRAAIETIYNRLEELPCVQPKTHEECTETHACDCISRRAMMKEFSEFVRKSNNSDFAQTPTWNDAVSLVGSMQSAQPEPQWILCDERMPDDLSEVNVTCVNHNPEPYYEFTKDKPFTATAVYYNGKWYWWSTYTQDLLAEYGGRCNVGLLHEAIEVTAWMPLPSPYQKGAAT